MRIKVAQTELEKEHALYVRNIVFIKEQQVPPDVEIDKYDQDAIHFIGYNDQKEPIAASRLRWTDKFGKLERICVLKNYRNRSYGKQLIEEMESIIALHNYKFSMLHAQTHAKEFYERLGYEVVSKEFIDANIPHVKMTKYLGSSSSI